MFDDVHHVHLIGAGGIGISAIGKYLSAKGKTVTGSDATASTITDDLVARGIAVTIGAAAENIPAACDLVVYTEAVDENHAERAEATRRGIRQLGHFDFLGELSKTMRTICVTGTNGKSTTTAMLGKIFEAAGFDPTVFVGSLLPDWDLGNVRMGASELLIIEGDEYKQKMVKLFPETTVITNIEEDHLDVYRDLDHIVATFQELADKTTGAVFVNADDKNSQRITSPRRSTYSFVGASELAAEDRVPGVGAQSFGVRHTVAGRDELLGAITLHVPGAFNMMNALAATTVALNYGLPFAVIRDALADFRGVWRRFERVGEYAPVHGGSATIISDYGHHPTAVKATLTATKEFFPGRRVVLCFQPHQHNRTKELFADFVASFGNADVLVLAEIYGVAGRTDSGDAVSSLDMLNAIQATIPAGSPDVRPMEYAKDLAEAEEKLRATIQNDDVVVIMGAGDIDNVARKLVG